MNDMAFCESIFNDFTPLSIDTGHVKSFQTFCKFIIQPFKGMFLTKQPLATFYV